MSTLDTLAIPKCPFCERELEFSGVGLRCICQAWHDDKARKAQSMMEQMKEKGWQEVEYIDEQGHWNIKIENYNG